MHLLLGSLVILALAGFTSLRTRAVAADPPPPRREAKLTYVIPACVAAVATFALQLLVVRASAHAQLPFPAWFSQLPILVIDDRAPFYNHAPYGIPYALVAILETLALGAVFAALNGRAVGVRAWRAIAVSSAIVVAFALFSTSITSFDIYAYAGDVHRGPGAAYLPSRVPLTGTWSVLNTIYGNPIFPSPYGPLWLGLSYVATAWTTSLGAALFSLRIVEVLAYAICLFALRTLRVPPVAVALFALNPTIAYNFIAAGHNDLTAVALVLAATALRTRVPAFAIVLAACAGAIKLPFVAIAVLAFCDEPSPPKRIAYGFATVALALAASVVFGGAEYVAAIGRTARIYNVLGDPLTNDLRFAIIAIVVGAIALALARRWFAPTVAWAFAALGGTIWSWYLAWGLPYALLERRWLAAFLVTMPLLDVLFASSFALTTFSYIYFCAIATIGPAIALLALGRERKMRARVGST